MTKQEALADFKEQWAEAERRNPNLKGDKVAKRCDWNDYVDYLYKDRLITKKQYETWSNPF